MDHVARGSRGQPASGPDFRWKVRGPVGLIFEIIGRRFVFSTRCQPGPAASRRRQAEWVRQRQLQSRRMQSDGRPAQTPNPSITMWWQHANQIEFVGPRPEQRKFEQRAGQRHRRALDRRRYRIGFLHGIGCEPVRSWKASFDVRVVDRPSGKPGRPLRRMRPWLVRPPRITRRIAHSSGPRCTGPSILHEKAELPLRTEATRLLRKPDVQLSARQRKCLVVQLHRISLPHSSGDFRGRQLFAQQLRQTANGDGRDVGGRDANSRFGLDAGAQFEGAQRVQAVLGRAAGPDRRCDAGSG